MIEFEQKHYLEHAFRTSKFSNVIRYSLASTNLHPVFFLSSVIMLIFFNDLSDSLLRICLYLQPTWEKQEVPKYPPLR